mgnify:CR=1 FL=1
MPVVSVVVPAYNAEKTILETIRSIQQQTFSNFELIVINDGSTDQTLEVLNTVEDSRLKVFSYENGGLPVARNRGIARATGEFITFIDADDLWTPDKLELQLAALQQHPDAEVAYSWTTFIDENGEFLYAGNPVHYEGNVYPELLVGCFISSGSNILARKQVIEEVGMFDPSLKSTEDWDCYLRLAARHPFALVPKYQILYRRSSGSMTSKVEVMEKYNLIVIERAFQAAPAELKHLKNQSLANLYRFLSKLCLEYIHNDEGVKKAGQKLQKSIQLYPMILLEQATQRLLVKIGLRQLFSYEFSQKLTRFIGRHFPMISIQEANLSR